MRMKKLRIMSLRRRKFRLRDKVKTKNQLVILRRVLYPIFEEMGISRNKVRSIKIRFGQSFEFTDNNDAFINIIKKEIVIEKGMSVASVIAKISHEYGHEITMFGKFRLIPAINISITFLTAYSWHIITGERRKNFIGEISAYNFEKRFINIFCKRKGCKIILTNRKFWEAMKSSPIHCISFRLKNIPLGSLIKNEYKIKK